MRAREKGRMVNWYLWFAQCTPNEFKALNEEEKDALDSEISVRLFGMLEGEGTPSEPAVDDFQLSFFSPSDKNYVSTLTADCPTSPIKPTEIVTWSGELWELLKKHYINRLVTTKGPVESSIRSRGGAIGQSTLIIKPEQGAEALPYLVTDSRFYGDSILHIESWGYSPTQRAFLDFCRITSGDSIHYFCQCEDLTCRKWFYNPTKKTKRYCSPKCMRKHRWIIDKQEEEYQLKRNIRSMYRNCIKEKRWSPERTCKHIEGHSKKDLKGKPGLRDWWEGYYEKKTS